MAVYVLTVDQRRSRRGRDLVDEAIEMLSREVPEPLLGFERTAGDEFQGVVADATEAVHVSLSLMRQQSWSVGIGVGEAEEPLPNSTRAARGAAFVNARTALDTAKRRPHTIAASADGDRAHDADVLLTLVAALISRRTEAGWEAIDLVETGYTITDAAAQLGISRQAVGQRLSVALWEQERDARPLAARLLGEAAG